jgi:hypothetical protein
MWRKNAFDRFTFPVAVFLKRFAAPLCVFNFGISFPYLAFSNQHSAFSPDTLLIWLDAKMLDAEYSESLRLFRALGRRLYRCGFLRLLSRFRFRIRRQNQVQRVPFLTGPEFHDSLVANIFNQPFQNLTSQTGARHFASTEKDRGLDFVTFIEKSKNVILFGDVVVVVHINAELHFLDHDSFLVLLGFALFFLLLVQEFPEVHDAAYGWVRCR